MGLCCKGREQGQSPAKSGQEMRPKKQVASYGEPSSWKETPGTRLEWQQGKQVPSSPAAAAAGPHPPSTNPQRTAKRLVPWPTSLTAQTAKKWSLSLSSLTETGRGKYRRDKKKRSPWSRYPWDTGWSQDTLMGCRDQYTTLWWEAGYVHNHKEFLTCFQRKLQQQWRHLVDVTFQRKNLTDLIGVCRSPTGIFDLMNWKSIAPVPWHFCHNKLPWTGMGWCGLNTGISFSKFYILGCQGQEQVVLMAGEVGFLA